MKLQYLCPHWGQESSSASHFLQRVVNATYDGIEINLPDNEAFTHDLMQSLEKIRKEKPDFRFVAQCILDPYKNESVDAFLGRMAGKLKQLGNLQPDFINAHTGKDYFTFEDNCRAIEVCFSFSAQTNVRVLHETHRGRFSFHAATLIAYLHKFPELELVGDYSHFCVVSESMLQGQEHLLAEIAPRISHLHARVGFEQAPQVSDPMAPEWADHLSQFTTWWKSIVQIKQQAGWPAMTLTPEFGPAPYMPALPFTQQPIGNQWAINQRLMAYLKNTL